MKSFQKYVSFYFAVFLKYILKIFDVAQKHNLTFYNAAYLELAMDLKLPLATYDQQLIEAAKAEGVSLVE